MPIIEVPGHGDVEFPDSMSDADMVAALKKLAPPTAPAPSAGDAFQAGATRGIGDRILARAQALGAQNAPLPQNLPSRSMAEQLLLPQAPNRPVDEARFETDRTRILGERRAAGAQAQAGHGVAYLAGEAAPALASVLVPGGAEAKGGATLLKFLKAAKEGAAVGGAQGVLGSESDDLAGVAKEGAVGAALGGALGTAAEGVAHGVSSLASKILPRAKAFLGRATTAIADRSAGAAEATAKSAQGSAGASRANASRTLERLGMDEALPAADRAANEAALATPEASQLASELAARARGELPEKLAHVQAAETLAAQTAAEAALARTPEAVAAMEKQMRSEVLKRLATRYALPAAVGGVAGQVSTGHAGYGAMAGFAARPMLRATLRGLTSPAFAAPAGRALVAGTEALADASAGEGAKAAALLEPSIATKIEALIKALREPRQVGQLAQADTK